jgi:hypothetical protein
MWALPTGVSLFSTNIFAGPPKPYFDYEHDPDKTEKKGTEDCYATRNLSLYWHTQGVGEVCFAACDSWAWHHKPKKVGKPEPITMDVYAKNMQAAILNGRSGLTERRYVDYTQPPDFRSYDQPSSDVPAEYAHLPRRGQVLRPDQNEVYVSDEEFRLLEQAAAVPPEIGAMRQAVDQAEANGEFEPDPDYGVVTSASDQPKSNGQAKTCRMICNRKVAVLGQDEVPEQEINAIEALTDWLVGSNNSGPLEVAVAHPGTGQGSAAILGHLPEGSHLYALDSVMVYQFSSAYADEFSAAFAPELESGRVMARLYERKFPWPTEQQHLDMVFIERGLKREKLLSWVDHVRQGGILAGLGYEKNQAILEEFASEHSLEIKTAGDVWAIPVN